MLRKICFVTGLNLKSMNDVLKYLILSKNLQNRSILVTFMSNFYLPNQIGADQLWPLPGKKVENIELKTNPCQVSNFWKLYVTLLETRHCSVEMLFYKLVFAFVRFHQSYQMRHFSQTYYLSVLISYITHRHFSSHHKAKCSLSSSESLEIQMHWQLVHTKKVLYGVFSKLNERVDNMHFLFCVKIMV